MNGFLARASSVFVGLSLWVGVHASGQDVVRRLVDVPDYAWHAGCFGTATGNLMAYWDRHGFPDFYTGPTGDGLAPLNSSGANAHIRALWASEAGVDGRPANQPGHMDDYWVAYETAAQDPYVTAGRTEHTPDCTGDFIGLNQRKWANLALAGECDGNIDGYSFVFWATNGDRRVNYTPSNNIPDIQSGLRAWTRWRGSEADVFTQLADFNPKVPNGKGFTFSDLRKEIDEGYPVLVFLQSPNQLSRSIGNMNKANPAIHGMLIYGYADYVSFGFQEVYYRTSWGYGEYRHAWDSDIWEAALPTRGVIGYRPKPKIKQIVRAGDALTLTWHAPVSRIQDDQAGLIVAHRYQLQKSTAITGAPWQNIGAVTTNLTQTVLDSGTTPSFYRLRLLYAGQNP